MAEIRQHAPNRVSNVEVANKLGVGRNLVQKLEKISACSDVNLLMATGQIRSVEFAYKMAVLEGADKSLFKAACKVIAERRAGGRFQPVQGGTRVPGPKKPVKKQAGRPAKIRFPP